MKNDVLYIKIPQNVQILNKKIFLEDIAKLYSVDKNMVAKLGKEVVFTVKAKEECKYSFSILKLIEIIHKQYPEVEVVNLGETDFIVDYVVPKQKKQYLELLKTAVVCVIMFFGAAFTIMTFNTDVSVSHVFDDLYKLVTGTPKTSGSVLEIAYAAGLPIGILVFYNHFSRLKVHSDPTPIQIEMRSYEEDVNKAVIEDASREGKTIDAN